jgi:ASC-1-like (ASCH) protein
VEIITARDLLTFLQMLNEEQLNSSVYFDTDARTFDYHMAKVGRIYYENQPKQHIVIHEERE